MTRFIIFSLVLFSSFSSIYGSFPLSNEVTKGLTPEQILLLEKRVEKLQMGMNGLEEKRRRRRPRADRNAIVASLNKNLKGEYLDDAKKILGACLSGDCLLDNDGDVRFIDREGSEYCYPNTTCGFYKCMEEKYRCMDVGYEYFENLAFPTCSSYIENIKKDMFSIKGSDWIYSVMVCLQKGLFDECSLKGNCEFETREKACDHITEFTLEFHPGCYINSGVGVCKLPLRDQINIWRTVWPYLTDRETIEAFKVVRTCLFGN